MTKSLLLIVVASPFTKLTIPMISPATACFGRVARLASLSLLAGLALALPVKSQEATPDGSFPQPSGVIPVAPTAPDNSRPLSQSDSLLSIAGGERLIRDADVAISAQNYKLAAQRLQEARRVFNQLSNFHQTLASSFTGIDSEIASGHRQKALNTAKMRDNATYMLAIVHRAQNQSELAVPLLIQIIGSQGVTRELGTKAYGQLFELGFSDIPYPRPQGGDPQATSGN